MGVWCTGRFLTGIPVGRAEGEGDDEDGRNEILVATPNGPAAERQAPVTPAARPTPA